jgi:uncharacterized protein (DUF1015 family)
LMLDSYPRLILKPESLKDEEILTGLLKNFNVTPLAKGINPLPETKGTFSIFLGEKWLSLKEIEAPKEERKSETPSSVLSQIDVQVVTEKIISPIFRISSFSISFLNYLLTLDIFDLANDPRIEFFMGTQFLDLLETKCKEESKVAILYPTVKIHEIRAVADEGKILPPKSTCFLLKPRSGSVVRLLKRDRFYSV